MHDETLRLMNEGASLDEIVHSRARAGALLDRPYLRPVYDEPEFVVRNIWRLYGGWWDGDPAHLKPAHPCGVRGRDGRARRRRRRGGHPRGRARRGRRRRRRCASPVNSRRLAVDADPTSNAAHGARAEVFERRVAAEASTMSKGVFSWTAAESRRALEP